MKGVLLKDEYIKQMESAMNGIEALATARVVGSDHRDRVKEHRSESNEQEEQIPFVQEQRVRAPEENGQVLNTIA